MFFSKLDMDLYRQAISANPRTNEYQKTQRYGSLEDCQVAIVQGIVQDVFHLSEDADKFRNLEVKCRFFRLPGARGECHGRVYRSCLAGL